MNSAEKLQLAMDEYNAKDPEYLAVISQPPYGGEAKIEISCGGDHKTIPFRWPMDGEPDELAYYRRKFAAILEEFGKDQSGHRSLR